MSTKHVDYVCICSETGKDVFRSSDRNRVGGSRVIGSMEWEMKAAGWALSVMGLESWCGCSTWTTVRELLYGDGEELHG